MTQLHLTPMDARFFGADPLEVVMVSPGRPDIERVAAAFRAALAHVPLFASRIVTTASGSAAIVFEPGAARFQLNPPLPLGCRDVGEDCDEVLPERVESLTGGHTAALALTELRDGFAVCLATSHVVGDSRANVLLLRSWMSAYRGGELPAVSRQRDFVGANQFAHIEPLRIECAVPPQKRAAVARETLRIEAGELEAMMARVGGSLHQAATVLLLHRFRARLFAQTPLIRLRVPVDIRGILPGLSRDYVGNAFLDALVELTVDDLERGPAHLTGKGSAAIARIKHGDDTQRLLQLTAHGLEPTAAWAHAQPPFDPRCDVIVSNLVGRVAPVGVDLGHGPVVFIPRTPAPRGFLIMPAEADALAVQLRL